ncbi:hypothetical protein AAVH_16634 [Aphelenchoides avenae]|nr:hypothetical protein AAVH_16634 [Aphelenchus avenae]
MLPNEPLLIVLQFADYGTLVLAKLAGARFQRLAVKYAEELALRRRFVVTFGSSYYISYLDAIGEDLKKIPYAPFNQPSLEAACRELKDVIGPHAVATLLRGTAREVTFRM